MTKLKMEVEINRTEPSCCTSPTPSLSCSFVRAALPITRDGGSPTGYGGVREPHAGFRVRRGVTARGGDEDELSGAGDDNGFACKTPPVANDAFGTAVIHLEDAWPHKAYFRACYPPCDSPRRHLTLLYSCLVRAARHVLPGR